MIEKRLETEISNYENYGIQYWPCFHRETEELIGCCGFRPYEKDKYEKGNHLLPKYWGKGYATEAANAVIQYAFNNLNAILLFADHNPNNSASRDLVKKLGFTYIKDNYYEPTGLYHPSY